MSEYTYEICKSSDSEFASYCVVIEQVNITMAVRTIGLIEIEDYRQEDQAKFRLLKLARFDIDGTLSIWHFPHYYIWL